jgi:hypothetical protein
VRKVGYVAIDHGPRLTLGALESRLPGPLLEGSSGDWTNDLRKHDIELLVCGTSDSAHGRDAEAGAQRTAHALAIPTVVVEDFPGNFAPVSAAPPRLLCVESTFAADLARRHMPALAVHVGPAIRYDALRRDLGALRVAHGNAERAVLWIGQPDTADALRTLETLLPAFDAGGWKLWFRAHPRDEGYVRGAYGGLAVEDITSHPLDACLARRPRLVITQFSSGAVEAGFRGIPSLNVLLPEAGGGALARKKGYSVLPWCEEGAAFLVVRPQEVEKVLDCALDSADARRRVMEAFDRYFRVTEQGTPALINLLYNQGLL